MSRFFSVMHCVQFLQEEGSRVSTLANSVLPTSLYVISPHPPPLHPMDSIYSSLGTAQEIRAHQCSHVTQATLSKGAAPAPPVTHTTNSTVATVHAQLRCVTYLTTKLLRAAIHLDVGDLCNVLHCPCLS